MNVTGHLAVGSSFYLMAATLVPEHPLLQSPPLWFAGLSLTLIGALLPDIDHPNSTFGQKVKFISYPLSMIFGHRGITHSLLAICMIVFFLLRFMDASYNSVIGLLLSPLMLGYLSHLFADALSPMGVPLLYPNKKRFTIPIIRGSISEFIVYSSMLSVSIWLYFNNYF